MQPNHIIGLIGTNASGKSFLSDYIVQNYGGVHVKFSEYLANVLKAMNMEGSKQNMIKLSIAIRNEFGEETLSHAVANDVEHMDADLVIVDGIRRVGDLARFKAMDQFTLIGIDADPKLRFERMRGRSEKSDDQETTWESFMEKEKAPTEVTIPEVMKLVDHQIDNNGSKTELEQKIDQIMAEIGISKKA